MQRQRHWGMSCIGVIIMIALSTLSPVHQRFEQILNTGIYWWAVLSLRTENICRPFMTTIIPMLQCLNWPWLIGNLTDDQVIATLDTIPVQRAEWMHISMRPFLYEYNNQYMRICDWKSKAMIIVWSSLSNYFASTVDRVPPCRRGRPYVNLLHSIHLVRQ